MKKGITYDEKELKENFERLNNYFEGISNFYGLIYKQLKGDRNNIEFEDVRKGYEELEKIGDILNEFGISKIKLKSLDSVLKELEKARNREIY